MSIGSLGEIAGSGHPNQAGFGDRITEVTIRPETLEQITARPPERPRHRAEQGDPVEPPSNFWVHPDALAVAKNLLEELQLNTATPTISRPVKSPSAAAIGDAMIVGSRAGVQAAMDRLSGKNNRPAHRAPVHTVIKKIATPAIDPSTIVDPQSLGLTEGTASLRDVAGAFGTELAEQTGSSDVIYIAGKDGTPGYAVVCNNPHSAASIAQNIGI